MILVPDFTRKVTQMSTSSFSELRDPILMIFFVKKSRQLGLDENIVGSFILDQRGWVFYCKHKIEKLRNRAESILPCCGPETHAYPIPDLSFRRGTTIRTNKSHTAEWRDLL